MSIDVRKLQPGDTDLAVAVAMRLKGATISTAHADRLLANPANCLMIATVDDGIAGIVFAHRLDRLDRETRQLMIYEVHVDAWHRRQGVGTALMAYVQALVEREGLMEAFVVADSGNTAAIDLYRKTGARIEEESAMVLVYPGS